MGLEGGEGEMRALVIYDSQFGNTEQVSRAIGQVLDVSMEVIIRRAGYVDTAHLQEADIVVVGSPTHRWGMSRAIKDFFRGLKGRRFEGKCAAAFDTRFRSRFSGSAAKKIDGQLRKLGFQVVASPFGAYVEGREGPLKEGEIERAKVFGATVWGEGRKWGKEGYRPLSVF